MNVLMISAELAPFAKTGGLADAVTGLSDALAARGHDVRVLLPKYEHLPPTDLDAKPLATTASGLALELRAPRRRRRGRWRGGGARGAKGPASARRRQAQSRSPDRLSAGSRGADAGTDLLRRRPRRGPLHSARGARGRPARDARLASRRAALPRLALGARAADAADPSASGPRADGAHAAQQL